ncbi:MAG: hypothetical protein JJ863_13310 [Deltaproteobacteria bacterium]|nr:hypothetical protein [Deltaproteobacteria bacterium]
MIHRVSPATAAAALLFLGFASPAFAQSESDSEPATESGADQEPASESESGEPESASESESESESGDQESESGDQESESESGDRESESGDQGSEPEEPEPNLGAPAADLEPEPEPEDELDNARTDAQRTAIQEERRDSRYAPSVSLHGEYRLRFNMMSDIPLQTQERTGLPTELGQNYWANQWLRATGKLELGNVFAFHAQLDVADGMIVGDEAQGVSAAELPRDGETAFDGRGLELRWLYGEWRSPIGVFRAGLQPSHWGLGLLANDGTRWSPFGDYRYGNSNIRLLFATRPLGEDTPFTVAIAGDVVYRDPVASLGDGERALQAVLAAFYGDGQTKTIGAYVVYRSQRNEVDALDGESFSDDSLDVWILDLFAQWEFEDPAGGDIELAFEGVHLRGETTLTRSVDNPTHDVRQWMWAAQAGRRGKIVDGFFEAGYTSGDSNTEDSVQRRATMHPDHRIGLILFPELMAWQTARSATLAGSDELSARPSPGSQLLPTDGGVAGATYIFNWWDIRPVDFMNIRLGWLWARATSDVVDPYQQRSQSRSANYLGGDPRARDLGLELDAMVLFTKKLPYDVTLQLGADGGVLFPGKAFDDATGQGMDPVFLGRIRAGLTF